MNGRIPYWYESAAGTASVSPRSAGVAAEWPVGPVCSVVAVQTASCSRVGVWVFWADWRAGPSWPGGTGGVTTWSLGLEKEQEGRVKGHVQVFRKRICARWPYRRKTSSAASSAPSGGGAAGAPGDLGSLWTRGLSEAAQSPAVAQATRAWCLSICPSTPWRPKRTNKYN